eukprot:g29804.t1
MNPLKSTYNTDYAERLCHRTSHKLLNHLVHQLYSKHHNLEIEIESTFSACVQDIAVQLRDTAKQMRQRIYTNYMHTKNKKQEKLGITTSNNQVSPSTTVESSITTGKSIVSLDGHLCTSLYCKPMDNLMMLHSSSFHPKHIKTAIPYGQALRIYRICSDEEEQDGHLK